MGERISLRRDEQRALDRIEASGTLAVQLYRQGHFSEPDFVLFGVLERLVIRRCVTYLGRTGDDRNATYTYGQAATRHPVRVAA